MIRLPLILPALFALPLLLPAGPKPDPAKLGLRAPLRFEPLAGTEYLAHGADYSMRLASHQTSLHISSPSEPTAALRMRLLDARPARPGRPEGLLPSVSNYYLGTDPAKWRTGVPNYARIRFEQVYPGIDVVYYGNNGKLEYDFLVQPGADPARIRLSFSGADSIRLNATGDLVLTAAGRQIIQRKPVIYQEIDGVRIEVAGHYRLFEQAREVQLALAHYDRARPLVIDPVIAWATFFGGSLAETGFGIAVDATGAAYVIGDTTGTIPIVNPTIQGTKPGSSDAFVAKYSSTGALLYSTYLGGPGFDSGYGIAVLPSGEAFITGGASAGFPLLGASQGTIGSSFQDAFVARLSPSGGLVYSTYLGGPGGDVGFNIAVDAAGFAYVLGTTAGPTFPTVAPSQAVFGGGSQDLFVAKFTPAGAVAYATFLGGTGGEVAGGIAVDGAGSAYVAGGTSTGSFPILNAVQPVRGGMGDATITKLSSTGAVVYSTFFGGPNADSAADIAADSSGVVYVTGGAGPGFPLLNASQPAHGGGTSDAYLLKLGTVGQVLFSTYIGGPAGDSAHAVALAPDGNIYAAGVTQSGFPTLLPTQAAPTGGNDGWVAKFSASGERLFATYLGGTGSDSAASIATDPFGSAYIAGLTNLGTFPVVNPAQSTSGGSQDAFVVKIAEPSAEVGLPVIGSGTTQTLTLKFSHPQGFANLGVVNALINNFLNGDNACYIAYSQPLQTLYLVNDLGPGSGISAGLTLGSAGTVANSQCTILGTGSSASGSGNDLTLNLNIQFKAAFNGNKVIYLASRDDVSGNSGWRTMGASIIPEATISFPRGNALAPVSGSGKTQVLTLTYQDATAATNLQTAWALINTAIDGRSACYVAYSQPANALFLVPDNGDGAMATSTPLGGSGILENSQCRVAAQGSSAVVNGNQLTLNLNVTFKTPFLGTKGVWAAAQTLSLQTSPWKIVGAWQIPP